MNWIERAEVELEDDLAAGNITLKEYQRGVRDLYAEVEEARNNAAQKAYDNY